MLCVSLSTLSMNNIWSSLDEWNHGKWDKLVGIHAWVRRRRRRRCWCDMKQTEVHQTKVFNFNLQTPDWLSLSLCAKKNIVQWNVVARLLSLLSTNKNQNEFRADKVVEFRQSIRCDDDHFKEWRLIKSCHVIHCDFNVLDLP